MFRSWEWWLPEERRGWACVVAATVVVTLLAATGVVQADGRDRESLLAYTTQLVVGELALYLVLYVVITATAFRHVPGDRLRAWAAGTAPGNWVRKYVIAAEPGAGLASTASTLALMAVFLLPRAGGETTVPMIVSVVLITASWLALALSYAVDYLCRDQRGPRALAFPETPEPEWGDYLYFAIGVSTTFGTTDTTVRTTALRRVVTTHAIFAFVFNTVILAAVVGVIVGSS